MEKKYFVSKNVNFRLKIVSQYPFLKKVQLILKLCSLFLNNFDFLKKTRLHFKNISNKICSQIPKKTHSVLKLEKMRNFLKQYYFPRTLKSQFFEKKFQYGVVPRGPLSIVKKKIQKKLF